jgi:outer membrane protein assembly factor BamB
MISASRRRKMIAGSFALIGLWIEIEIGTRERFARAPGGSIGAGLIAGVAFIIALVVILTGTSSRGWRGRRGRALLLAPALGFTAAFVLVPLVIWYRNQKQQLPPTFARETAMIAELRRIAAAQEQYRLVHETYATSSDSLRRWASLSPGSVLSLRVRGDSGWAGTLARWGGKCAVWVRDSTLRDDDAAIEGSPSCGRASHREARQIVATVIGDRAANRPFSEQEIGGEWVQHRGDDHRLGTVSGDESRGAFRWTTTIGGELRSPVAIVGGQVFVGAHGNGELAALSLRDGAIGYRLRAPNWVHHEPIVTRDLAIVGFGNNEQSGSPTIAGTPPGGILAFDRRTGRERWQANTFGPVMTSPVIVDSVVAVITGAGEAIGWRVSDGTEIWRRRLPSFAPMGNPLLADSLMVFGVEPRMICALIVRSGRIVYCRSLAGFGWGAGHTSVARTGNVVLLTFDEGQLAASHNPNAPLSIGGWFQVAAELLSLPMVPPATSELVMVAVDLTTGRELWRRALGAGRENLEGHGHIAGTPTIVGDVAYVPSPMNGEVVAVRVDSGRIVWKTPVHTARGSVLVTHDAVLAATTDSAFVVLNARDGRVRCRQKLPARSDRAGPTLAGETAILTLLNGTVLARPIADWLACRA